jgi:hypothetical protein
MATTTTTAHDGLRHAPSSDPSVHRPLVLVDPPLQGRDVANLQRALIARLKARGLDDDVPVATHGKFTRATALACIDAQYVLGLRSDTFQLRDAKGHRVVSEGAQAIIRRPGTRTPEQLARARQRADDAARGRAFFDDMARRLGVRGRGAADAVRFAEAQIGVREHPPMSNSGPKIDEWCRLAGFDSPVPWCGCFVNACIMAGGLPSGAGWIGSTVLIRAHAMKGTDGWRFLGPHEGRMGDLALYDDGPGGDPVVHVEIVRKQLSPTRYSTVGGNTSSGNGSPSDGGMVARHDDRSTTGGFHVIGFARPPYPRT